MAAFRRVNLCMKERQKAFFSGVHEQGSVRGRERGDSAVRTC